MIAGIYQILNVINNKKYIGSAMSVEGRLLGHSNNLKNGKHCNRYLQFAWNKYGEDAFRFEVLLYCDKEDLLFYEQRAIDVYQSADGKGYNLSPTAGSPLGIKLTEETKDKISRALIGKPKVYLGGEHPLKGKIRPEEVGRKISAAKIGHTVSMETRKKISETAKGRIIPEETRRKISDALKGRKFSNEHCKNLSLSQMGNTKGRARKGILHSEETKRKISETKRDSKLTEEHKQKISIALLGRVRSIPS